MAADSESRAISTLSPNGNVTVFNGSVGYDHSVSSTPTGDGLAQGLNCEYNPENTEFVGLFTNDDTLSVMP